jgi:hypothetical protein
VAAVLGRVTGAADLPRGPDAKYGIRVPRDWIDSGATIEVRLPRHLECASCGGGGCDACGGSGALTLRDRGVAAEAIQVTLPQGGPVSGVTLRIPDAGGHPGSGSDLPRGLLLLSVLPGAQPAENVRLWRPAIGATRQSRVSLRVALMLAAAVVLSLLLLRLFGCR